MLCTHMLSRYRLLSFLTCISFFFNATATTEIYTLSLHDALPISPSRLAYSLPLPIISPSRSVFASRAALRSEEHTSELQSRRDLVCRLLLEKKKYHDNPSIPDDEPNPAVPARCSLMRSLTASCEH